MLSGDKMVKVAVYFIEEVDGSYVFCEYPAYLITDTLAVSFDGGSVVLGHLVPSLTYPGYYEPVGRDVELSAELLAELVDEEVFAC